MGYENEDQLLSIWDNQNLVNPLQKEVQLELIDQIASLFAIGPYYYYILNYKTQEIAYVHRGIKTILGLEPQCFNLDVLNAIMKPEDLARMAEKEKTASLFLKQNIAPKDIPSYKIAYLMRLKHRDGSYKTILHQSKVLNLTNDGAVQTSIHVHTDVTYLKMPINHQISFISQDLPSYLAINTSNSPEKISNTLNSILTKREKEIIYQMALGETSKNIADTLCISVHTVNTHKKNIMKKSKCKCTSELISQCLMQGII
ncbi:LuxR C-terminal-related transcriptional regulator [Flavobacteriaceae bacterium GSB9]|nr:LuxR C-terminal-related transcriptional regulator [Flavobacteriaceae bacterium GSB9]